jgi:hypothetical protein
LRSDPLRVRIHSLRRTLGDLRLRVVLVSAIVLALGAGTARAQAPTPDPAPPPPAPSPQPQPIEPSSPATQPSESSSPTTGQTATPSTRDAKSKAKHATAVRHFQRLHPSFAVTAPGADMRSGVRTRVLSQEILDVARVRGRAALMIGLAALALLLGAMALFPRFYGLAARTRTRLSFFGR